MRKHMKKKEIKKIEKCCWECQVILSDEQAKQMFKDKLKRMKHYYNTITKRERLIEESR